MVIFNAIYEHLPNMTKTIINNIKNIKYLKVINFSMITTP